MKVIGFVGSPQKDGNTDQLIQKILDGARDAGAEVKIVYLNDLDINGCQGCHCCQEKGNCAQNDDMIPLHEEIRGADGIILGAPVYMGAECGQMKVFIDRWMPFYNPDLSCRLEKGKKAVLVFSQGNPDAQAYNSSFAVIEGFVKSMGMELLDTLVVAGVTKAADDQELMKKAYELGKKIAG